MIQGVKRGCRWPGASLMLVPLLAGCGTELFGIAPGAGGGAGSAATASALAASAPPSASPVSATCHMGYVNIPVGSGVAVSEKKFQATAPVPDTADGYSLADYEAMQVIVSAAQDEQVSNLTVVWYTASGQEISSGTLDIGDLITAGQSLTFTWDESMGSDPNPPAGAATCTIPSWS
jgi:hypothetical protein